MLYRFKEGGDINKAGRFKAGSKFYPILGICTTSGHELA